jgi:Phosphopantetheine attachment site
MVPTRWRVISEWPLSPTGKVDRGQLLRGLSVDGGAAGAEAPGTATRDQLTVEVARIWCTVLRLDAVEGTASFIESGGNSILAMQLASRVTEQLSAPVEPADVLLTRSFDELAAHIGRTRERGGTGTELCVS